MSDMADREKLIREKVQKEDESERLATGDARELVLEFLLEQRGYLPEDIETDRKFPVSAGNIEEPVSVDYIIKLKGKRYMAIKCSMALESRERHILAFSRAADDVQIPYSVITDGLKAYLMETASGKRISEDMNGLPSREAALKDVEYMEFRPCPAERAEREKRILLAFECASCPRTQP